MTERSGWPVDELEEMGRKDAATTETNRQAERD